MLTTLTIAGTPYAAIDRANAQIEIDFWSWDLDDDLSAEFHETKAGPAVTATFHCGQAVTIDVDSGSGDIRRFTGTIETVVPTFTGHGWQFGYLCLGPKNLANKIPITAPDASGQLIYNLPPDDPYYVPSNSGLSVGQIITNILALHAGELTAIGVATDATTTLQLAALTVVPNETVYIEGVVANQITAILDRWARNVRSLINADGLYRFYDTTAAATTLTLTMNLDPIDPICFGRDTRQCAPRVVVRGKGKIYPGYVSLTDGSLTRAWTGGQQTSWKLSDYTQPSDAYDTGTVNSVDSPTQVTVHSGNAARTWVTNFWNNREAWIYLSNSIGSALTFSEQRPVTACASMSAGGTATVTLGYDLENAGASAYNQYKLIGRVADLTAGGLNNVWRLYNVTDPGLLIANHLVPMFPAPVPFMNAFNNAESSTSYPVASIIQGLNAWPATFKVLPGTGQILFDEPVVKPFNSPSTLNTGGGAVTAPTDLYVLLAYSRGALTAIYPPDVGGNPTYGGTSHSVDGLQRTLTVEVESWVYAGNQSLMDDYAQMLWKSVCDTVVTGNVNYKGAYTDAFDPDLKLNIAGNGFITGNESLGVPIRGFKLNYNPTGAGGLNYSSNLRCSSLRNPRTASTMYMHTTQWSQTGFKMDFGELTKVFTTEPFKKAIDKQMDSKLSDASGTKGYKALAESLTPQAMEDRRRKQEEEQEKARKHEEEKRQEQSEQGFGGAGFPMSMGGMTDDEDMYAQSPSRKKKGKEKPKRKKLSRKEAQKKWQQEAADRMAYANAESAAAGEGKDDADHKGDEKPHTFTGPKPVPRKRKLTRDQARKDWQKQAAQRVQQQPPVDAGDIESITGVGNVEGLERGSGTGGGKTHSFTGLALKRPSRKIARTEAIKRATKAASARRASQPADPYRMGSAPAEAAQNSGTAPTGGRQAHSFTGPAPDEGEKAGA